MAEYVELYIDQGSNFSTTVTINDDNTNLPQNLYSYTVTGSLRRSLLSPNTAANLSCSVYDSANGEILITLGSGVTSNLRAGSYFFDVKTYDSLTMTSNRLIEGMFFVTPSVTK